MAAKDKPVEFESAMRELETITQWFESDNVDLDEGLKKFERGMELASSLQQHLQTVENRVEKIRARFDAPSSASATEPTVTSDDPFDVGARNPSDRLD